MTNRSKQALQTKKKIAKVTMDLCTHKDIDQVKISDICQQAEVSTGCFYHHFKSKEDVLSWSYYDFDSFLEEAIEQKKDYNDLGIIDRIIFVSEQYYLFLVTQDLNYTINAYRSQLLLGSTYVGDRTRFFYLVIHTIAVDWIQSTELKHTWSSEELADFILRCIRGIAYDWCSRDGSFDLLKIGIKELRIIFEGLNL